MKFKIIISKWANFFFFVSNLSEWSPYCRKHYNALWLKNRPLNKREQNVLKQLSTVLKEKKYKEINLLLTSVNKNEFWKNVPKTFSEKESIIFKESSNIFSERFDKLWKTEEKNLIKIKNNIIKNLSISSKHVALIKKLYGVKNSPESINIFLFTSPIKKQLVYGGSGFGTAGIGIECSEIAKDNNKNDALSRVILHEITHAYFEKRLVDKLNKFISSKYFQDKYRGLILKAKVYKQINNILGPVKELILVSLLPEGYLAEKFFGLNVINNLKERNRVKMGKLEKNYYDLMLFGIFKMYGFAKDYSDNQKPIGKKYIKEAAKCWIEFEQIDLSKLKI